MSDDDAAPDGCGCQYDAAGRRYRTRCICPPPLTAERTLRGVAGLGGAIGDAVAGLLVERDEALAALDAARAEVEQLHREAADALVNQAKFKSMSVEEGAAVLNLESPREIVIAWVWAARAMLGDAPNYSETRIDFPSASMEVKAAGEVERYVFTVQRAGRVTPHEARLAAEAERDEAWAEVERLSAARDTAETAYQGQTHIEGMLRAELERLRAQRDAVLEIHRIYHAAPAAAPYCEECPSDLGWPCATARALGVE